MFEVSARLFLKESDTSYGVLWDTELPPHSVIPVASVLETDPDAWHQGLVVNGKRITTSDLVGRMREDANTGWAPSESSVSTNGWWQTNKLGARAVREFSAQVTPGVTRVLVFGDSFAQGSRLPQEETWAHRLRAAATIFPSITSAAAES